MSEGRIDYVRIRITGDALDRAGYKHNLEERAKALMEKHGIARKGYDDSLTFDRVLKRWYSNFNCWGELAELFYNEMEVSEFNKVIRLDYRVECLNEQLDLDTIAWRAIKHAKRAGLARSFHDGPVRTKSNGRDTGGPSIIIGGTGSARRVALYQRGHEKPGVEAQISGKRLKTVISAAYDASVQTLHGFHAELKWYMRKELELLCRERLLTPLSTFDVNGVFDDGITPPDVQEATYEQVSLLWTFLDDAHQTRFTNDNGIQYPPFLRANDVSHTPLEEYDEEEWDRADYEEEIRQAVEKERNEAREAEIERVRREWPYHKPPFSE